MAKNTKNNTLRYSPGFVEPGVLYLAEEAGHRLRMGASAWRSARRAGLHIVRCGRNNYVFGDDLIAFFRRVQSSQTSGDQANRGW
jgi:hypothetical protein